MDAASSRSPANGPICSAACASGQVELLHHLRLLHTEEKAHARASRRGPRRMKELMSDFEEMGEPSTSTSPTSAR